MKPLLLLLSCILIARANEIVYKLSGYGQLVTSSTLRWRYTHKDDPYAAVNPHVIRGKGSGSAICRGYYQNTLVPGGTNPLNQCAAYFFEKLVILDDFQVLTDQTLTSRYEWFKWDIFTKVPVGAVAFTEDVADATFVAKTDSGKICELDKRRGLSGNLAVSLDGKSVTFVEKAYLLMELEPISYELNHMRFATWRAKVERTPMHLGHVLLSHQDSAESGTWQEVSSVVAYNATYNFYYGQLDGLIRALPTRAQTYGGGPKFDNVDFSWGLPLKFSRHRIEQVSATLMSDTAVNASVDAMLTKTELPYDAVLVAKFKDGNTRHYDISGTYQETLLANVMVTMGTPYFITNGTEAPTTTTTTTTSTTTTTTTVTSTPTTMSSDTMGDDRTTESVTMRPRRTTTPMPTEENPLWRFYPMEEDEDEAIESNEIPGMMSDEASGKHSERSSPMTDFHTESASRANDSRIAKGWSLISSTMSLLLGTLFLKAVIFI